MRCHQYNRTRSLALQCMDERGYWFDSKHRQISQVIEEKNWDPRFHQDHLEGTNHHSIRFAHLLQLADIALPDSLPHNQEQTVHRYILIAQSHSPMFSEHCDRLMPPERPVTTRLNHLRSSQRGNTTH